MKKRVKAMALVCVMAIISCKADASAIKKEKLETVRVIKIMSGTRKFSEDKDEINTLKWTIIKPDECPQNGSYICKYNKYGLVKEFYDPFKDKKYIYRYDDDKLVCADFIYYYSHNNKASKKKNRYEPKEEWEYDKKGRAVKCDGAWGIFKKYVYKGKKKQIKGIKRADGMDKYSYREYNYNEKRQISLVRLQNKISSTYTEDSVRPYEYDEHGNIITTYGGADEKANYQYDSAGYPISCEYGHDEYQVDGPPYNEVWHLEKYNFEYMTMKVPKKYIKTIKQQQWDIVNHFFTEDMFFDVITPYLNF